VKFFSLIFSVLISFSLWAQEPHYSLPYSSLLQINPGYAGSNGCPRIITGYRQTTPSLRGFDYHQRFHFSYDQFVPAIRSGVGLNILINDDGSGRFRTMEIGYVHSMYLQLTERVVIKPAIEFKYRNVTMRPEFTGYQPVNVLDLAAGFVLHTTDYYGGFAVYHIAEPSESFSTGIVSPPLNLLVQSHFGFNINLDTSDVVVSPHMLFFNEGNIQNFLLALDVSWKNFIWGIGYWDTEAFTLKAGYNLGKLRFAYAYDFTIKNFSLLKYNAHEVGLIYNFGCAKKQEMVRISRMPL
jgi:type IX secretion system PorP/SprF family membrane protein